MTNHAFNRRRLLLQCTLESIDVLVDALHAQLRVNAAMKIHDFSIACLPHPHVVHGRVHHVHASIGVAQRFSHDPTVTADDVLGAADAAMYTAKRLGKGMVVVHGSPLPEMT